MKRLGASTAARDSSGVAPDTVTPRGRTPDDAETMGIPSATTLTASTHSLEGGKKP